MDFATTSGSHDSAPIFMSPSRAFCFAGEEGVSLEARRVFLPSVQAQAAISPQVKTYQLSAYQPAYGGGEIYRKRMKDRDTHLLSNACWVVTTDFI